MAQQVKSLLCKNKNLSLDKVGHSMFPSGLTSTGICVPIQTLASIIFPLSPFLHLFYTHTHALYEKEKRRMKKWVNG